MQRSNGGDEATAADLDAREFAVAQEVVDRVTGNATELLAGFFDGVELAIFREAVPGRSMAVTLDR